MSATLSNMIALGTTAPDFNLPNTLTDEDINLYKLPNRKATVVMFICNHCPYVKHIIDEVVRVANDYQRRDVRFFAISSNDVDNYPQDSPEKMKEWATAMKFPFPYLYDESQDTAKIYNAACTPDFYVFDTNLCLVYRGQFDESKPKNEVPVTGNDMRQVLENILNDQPVDPDQKPSIGCNIKWKAN